MGKNRQKNRSIYEESVEHPGAGFPLLSSNRELHRGEEGAEMGVIDLPQSKSYLEKERVGQRAGAPLP